MSFVKQFRDSQLLTGSKIFPKIYSVGLLALTPWRARTDDTTPVVYQPMKNN